jgi:hypothetical protein
MPGTAETAATAETQEKGMPLPTAAVTLATAGTKSNSRGKQENPRRT